MAARIGDGEAVTVADGQWVGRGVVVGFRAGEYVVRVVDPAADGGRAADVRVPAAHVRRVGAAAPAAPAWAYDPVTVRRALALAEARVNTAAGADVRDAAEEVAWIQSVCAQWRLLCVRQRYAAAPGAADFWRRWAADYAAGLSAYAAGGGLDGLKAAAAPAPAADPNPAG